jgi:IPT/TIG domain
MRTRRAAVAVVAALAVVGTAGSARATTVTLGPSPLTVGGGAFFCDGPACASRSFVHLAGMGGALVSTGRGKVVTWRVGASVGSGSSVELWVVRATPASTTAVAGPSVATNVAGGDNAVNPPLPFEAGDSIAVTGLTSAVSSVGVYATTGGFMRMFAPGFAALNSPLTASTDNAFQMQFNADVVLAPVVSDSGPAIGPSSGGTAVTISGSNLDGATRVSFGGVAAPAFSVVSPTAISATAPPGAAGSTVDVTVTGVGGTSAAAPGARFSYFASSPPGGPDPAPALTRLAISPQAFLAGSRGQSVSAAKATGGVVSYTLSEPARTTFTVKGKRAGVKLGGTCLKATRRVRSQIRGRPHRCNFLVAVRGSFTRYGVQGSNRFRFTGRLGRRALTAGSYVLLAAPQDAAGHRGKSRSVGFEIQHPKH